jgi:hypothetical protein
MKKEAGHQGAQVVDGIVHALLPKVEKAKEGHHVAAGRNGQAAQQRQ